MNDYILPFGSEAHFHLSVSILDQFNQIANHTIVYPIPIFTYVLD